MNEMQEKAPSKRNMGFYQFFREELRKTIINLEQDIRCTDRDSKRTPAKEQVNNVTAALTRSLEFCK
jgi:hypothetical protein